MKFSTFDRKYSLILNFFHYTSTKYWSLSKSMSYEWKAKNEFYLDIHIFGCINLCRTYLNVKYNFQTMLHYILVPKEANKNRTPLSLVNRIICLYMYFYTLHKACSDTLFDVTRKVIKSVRLNQKRWPFSFIRVKRQKKITHQKL